MAPPYSQFTRTLLTPRLTLTLYNPTSPSETRHILACYNAPHTLATMGDYGLRTPADLETYFAQITLHPSHTQADYGAQPPVYIIREGPNSPQGTMVGFVAMASVHTEMAQGGEGTPHMGWLLREGWEGKGYASEAARRAREYWSGEVGVRRIRATVKPGNGRSLRVAERLGMRAREGLNGYGKVEFWWTREEGA